MDTDKKITISFLKNLFPPPSYYPKMPTIPAGLRKTAYDALSKDRLLTTPRDVRENIALWIYRRLSRQIIQELLEGKVRKCGNRLVSKRSVTNVAVGLAVFLEWRIAPIAGKARNRVASNWQEVAKRLADDERTMRWYGLKEKHLRGFFPRSNSSFYEYVDKGLACLADAINTAVEKHLQNDGGSTGETWAITQEIFARYREAMKEFLKNVPGQRKKFDELFVFPPLTLMSSDGREVPLSRQGLETLDSNLWITGSPGSGKSMFLRYVGLSASADTAVVWVHPEQAAGINRMTAVDEVIRKSIHFLRRKGIQVEKEATFPLEASRSMLFLVDLGSARVSPTFLNALRRRGRVVVASNYRMPITLEEMSNLQGGRKWVEIRIPEWSPHRLRRLASAYNATWAGEVWQRLKEINTPAYPLWAALGVQVGERGWKTSTGLIQEFVRNRAGEGSEGYLKTLRHLAWLKQTGSEDIPSRAKFVIPWAQDRGLLSESGNGEIEFTHDLILYFLVADHLVRKISNDPSSVGEAMEAVLGTAGWSDVARMAVEILISQGKWNLVERVLLEIDRLISRSWSSMGWIEGATPVGVAWKAAKKALENRNQEPEVEMKAVGEVYARALTSLKKLLNLALEISDYEFTDAVSGAIADLEPLPENWARYFADLVEQQPIAFWGISPLPSSPTITGALKQRLFERCSQGCNEGGSRCMSLLYRLTERKAITAPEILSICKGGLSWQEIFLLLALLGNEDAARFIDSTWPSVKRIGSEEVNLEKVIDEWSGDSWNLLEMARSMAEEDAPWNAYVGKLLYATEGEALFSLPLNEIGPDRLVPVIRSIPASVRDPEIINWLVQVLRDYTNPEPDIYQAYVSSSVYERLFGPGNLLAGLTTEDLLGLIKRENILLERYPVDIADILRRRLPDARISLFGRQLLESKPDGNILAAALHLLDEASEDDIRTWMHHDNLEVVAGAVFLADRMGMHDQILELMEERSSDLFGADNWVLGAASGELQDRLWGKYSLREALQEVLPHLPSEKAAAIIGRALAEAVERMSDSRCQTSGYTDHDQYLIDLMLMVSPGLLDERLEKLRGTKSECSVAALCHAGTPKSVERVIQWYLEAKEQEIWDAIHSEVKNPAALPVLTRYMVESDNAELRQACARAVKNIVVNGHADEVPASVWEALLKCLEDPDDITRGVCSRVLSPSTLREMLPRSRPEDLQEMLCRYLSEGSSKHKVRALSMWREARIAGMDVNCPEEVLLGLLTDAELEVRKAAVDLLEVYPQPKALQKARRMLKHEAEDKVRGAIVGTLASLGYEEDFDLLLRLALDSGYDYEEEPVSASIPDISYDEAFWARQALARQPGYWTHLLARIEGASNAEEILKTIVAIQAWRRGCILMRTEAGWECVGKEHLSA